MRDSPSTGERAVAPRDYAVLCLLTILNVMNFVDRQLLASFANFIVPDLGLSNTEFGLLTGFAFILFYSFAGLFMGALADTVHRPRLVAIGLATWSALTAASGMARGFVSLAIPRAFIGIGESILTPTSMSMLADRFPAARLGFAAGFYYMGVPIGAGASLLVAGYLGPAIGWRSCFFLLGALGVGLAVVTLFVKETPRRGLGVRLEPVPRQSFRDIATQLVHALRASPALTLTIAGGVCAHFILGAAAFDQLWFVQERGFERAFIAQAAGWLLVVFGVLGNIVGGAGSDWFVRVTGSSRPMFLFWIGLVFAPLGIAYRIVSPDSPLFWIGLSAGLFQLGAFYGPTFSTVQELVPPQIRATVVAFYILMLNLVGLGIGITFAGIFVDVLARAGVAEPYSWTLLVFTLLSALSIPLFWLAGRRFRADRERLFAEATRA